MEKRKVYFSLGSNLGDREANIREAVSRMDEAFGAGFSRLSAIRETKSWGFEAPDFLNAAVMYELDAKAEEILDICKSIERDMGRDGAVEFDSGGKRIYRSRVIDIDILLCGDERIDTPELKIPHPLMYERDFVMVPLNEIINE